MLEINAVIIAGGSGTRLWPLSRSMYPKQFLSFGDNKETIFQSTIKRISKLDINSITIVCNVEHRFLVSEQLKEIDGVFKIILEPCGKNTAPAATIAALDLDPNSLMLVLPADHHIENEEDFCKSVALAKNLASNGKLVTFGVIPDSPNIGYGYIKKGTKKDIGYDVKKFVEKPNQDKANKYFLSKDYLWNSGIFLFNTKSYLDELKIFRKDIYDSCKKCTLEKDSNLEFFRINQDCFNLCPSESIDFAVMEHTEKAFVIPISVGWNDLGSWSSLWEISNKDKNGNFLKGDIIDLESKNSFFQTDNILLTTIGIKDLVVVATKDSLLVADKNKVEDIKKITDQLKKSKRGEREFHRDVYRPWGKYDSIDSGYNYQVKRITVNPGAKLSLQKHNYRAEHWVVVSGTARVTKDKEVFDLEENQSTYIPLGAIHSLENPGKEKLELIEVQSGSYLGEDDIVRFDDIYGRETKKAK